MTQTILVISIVVFFTVSIIMKVDTPRLDNYLSLWGVLVIYAVSGITLVVSAVIKVLT